VHQTLTLDNKDTECRPELLMWQISDDITTLVLKNQSYDNLSHRRAVFFIDDKFFVLVDRAEGPAQGDVSVHFQFKEGKSVIDSNNLTARTDFEDGKNLFVKTKLQPGIKIQTEQGWVSYKYTKKMERPAFCYTLKKSQEQKNVDFITVLLPYEGNIPDVNINKLNSDSNEIAFEMAVNGKTYKVNCDLNKKTTELGYLLAATEQETQKIAPSSSDRQAYIQKHKALWYLKAICYDSEVKLTFVKSKWFYNKPEYDDLYGNIRIYRRAVDSEFFHGEQ
jgi:hypothetical protein